ncbi:fimbrial protein [Stenotrophomonas tumulicola]|uniref:Type 1 fimbrial protein n=1 Tax=Stenotrophomonas tumulicola TaxID=1685415 RepID=A0A7W3FL52_9GAMM|nr:fimbrial protein [Stenotrophomonas tumulicola]MBA8681549.1 type 1 fimbrial protein [Stenotrophomonas tumulicola]
MNRNIAIVVALLCASSAVHAQQGTITFVGQIVQETCVVAPASNGSGDGPDFTVHLPSLSQRALDGAGKRGVAMPFHVVVGSNERPCRQHNVRARFVDAGDNNTAGRLANRGTAANVDIVVQSAQQQDINLNSNAGSLMVPINPAGVGMLGWSANYHATAAASAGSVTARLQYLLDYP